MSIKRSDSRTPWPHLIRDLGVSIRGANNAVQFVVDYALWRGMNNYRWLSKLLLFMSIVVGLYCVTTLLDVFSSSQSEQLGVLQAVSGVALELKDFFMTSSFKYVVLVLIEVVIFHFVRRTLMIITGEFIDTSFKTFMAAQRRMLGVVFYAFAMELVWSIIVKVPFWFFDSELLKACALFIVQAFFTGFAIVDNYNEVYHLTIRQSAKYAYQYAGITTIVGAIVFLIIHIPLIGPIAGPLIGAVIATMSLHAVHSVDDNMEWVLHLKEERKAKKAAKRAAKVGL